MTPEPEAQSAPAKLRCLHYLERLRLSQGGVARAVLDLCEVLARRGHDVTLATRDATDAPSSWGGAGRPRVRLVGRSSRDRGLRAAVEEAEVVHLHGMWEPSNYAVARRARRVGTPWVISPHGMLDPWSMSQKAAKKRAFWRLAGKGLLEKAAAVHFTAEGEREQSRRWIGRGRGVVAPLVVDLSEFASLPGPELAERELELPAGARVLFLSRVHPKKGVEALLEAASQLTGDAAASLLIAGPGEPAYVDRLRSRAEALGIADRTRFLGPVMGRTKLSLYQAADVFVLPTQQENFGLVQVEALACGTPVVTTRGVDIWRELESAGAVVVDRKPGALADAARRAMADSAALGERGRAWVREALDPDATAARYEAMYEAARNGRPSEPARSAGAKEATADG